MIDFNSLTVAEVKQLASMAVAFLGSAPATPPLVTHRERPVVIWTDKRGVLLGVKHTTGDLGDMTTIRVGVKF